MATREVRKLLLSVVERIQQSPLQDFYNMIFCIVCFEGVARGLDEVSNNR